jgi:hypothetical protein
MENIKAKDEIITSIKRELFDYDILQPTRGNLEGAKLQQTVDEEWGWNQLSVPEYNERNNLKAT